MAKKSKALPKTEIISVRIDPQLRFAAEIAAGRERRPLSSLIEWMLERAMREFEISRNESPSVTAWEVAEQCWHVNPVWRLYKLSSAFPELMTFDERNQWNCIGYLLQVEREAGGREPRFGNLIDHDWLPALTAVWPMIVEQASRPDMDWAGLKAAYLAARPE